MSRQSCSCVPAVATRTQPRAALAPPNSLYQWREGTRYLRYDLSPKTAVCECRWSRTWLQRVPYYSNAASASDTSSVTVDTSPGASRVMATTPPVGAQPRGNSLRAVATTASYRGCINWKEAKAALAKRAPGVRKSAATSQSAAPKAQRAGPSAEQRDLGEVWNHVVLGGRVVKATTTPTPNPKPTPQPVRKAPSQPKVTTTRKTAGPKKPKPKSPAATKPAAVKTKKKAAAIDKTAAAKPSTPELVVPT